MEVRLLGLGRVELQVGDCLNVGRGAESRKQKDTILLLTRFEIAPHKICRQRRIKWDYEVIRGDFSPYQAKDMRLSFWGENVVRMPGTELFRRTCVGCPLLLSCILSGVPKALNL